MIRKIEALKPVKRKKVAAYARVSMETERLNHSLAAQIDYYNKLIQSNPEWEYVDVLNADGIKTKNSNNWTECGVRHILSNDTYAGNTLMQKYYTIDPIAKKKVRNKGEMPQYFAEGTHEAIIDKETFEKVQESAKLRSRKRKSLLSDCFSGIIKCENCGKSFHRTTDRDGRKR